jgi:hypothetical protein
LGWREYKIELTNFVCIIVEHAFALLVAVFALFVAKLNLLTKLSAMTRCWHKYLWLLHLYFDKERDQDLVGGTGVVPLLPGLTVDDSVAGSHNSANFAGEDATALAVATSVLLLG